MLQPAFLRDLQAEVVEAGGRIVRRHPGCRLLQGRCAQKQQAAELEVVAQRTYLAVDHRSGDRFAALGDEAVRVQHRGAGVFGNLEHALQSVMDQGQFRPAGIEKGEFRRCLLGRFAEDGTPAK